MSITRRIPRTVKETEQALAKAKAKKDSVAPADMVLTPTTQTAVDDQNNTFLALIAALVLALFVQVKSTNIKVSIQKLAKMWSSHYYQSYFNGCDRAEFEPESKVLYGLHANQNNVPNMGSEADLAYWGEKVVTGDAARVTAGGAPMSNPTAAAVKLKISDFIAANNDQSNKKVLYGNAEVDIKNALPAAINTVLKVLDEAETFYNYLPKETMRAKVREWGGVYESDVKTTITVTVKNKTTGALLPDALITVIESSNEQATNAAGMAEIVTTIAFGVTLETMLDGFDTVQTPLEFETGVFAYDITVEMPPV